MALDALIFLARPSLQGVRYRERGRAARTAAAGPVVGVPVRIMDKGGVCSCVRACMGV